MIVSSLKPEPLCAYQQWSLGQARNWQILRNLISWGLVAPVKSRELNEVFYLLSQTAMPITRIKIEPKNVKITNILSAVSYDYMFTSS